MGQEVRAVNLARAETRACITKALVKLTQEKALSSISVTELCQAAGVSRMAFYRNYDSKEGVFTARLEEVIADYARVTEPLLDVYKRQRRYHRRCGRHAGHARSG